MKKHQYKVIAIFVVLSGLMLQYQNCGAKGGANLAQDDTMTASQNASGDLNGIDQISTGDISFIQSKTIVSKDAKDMAVYGICGADQKGAILSWQLFNSDGSPLFDGQAACSKGSFVVNFEGVQSLACGSNLILKASFGAQAQSQTVITKSCN